MIYCPKKNATKRSIVRGATLERRPNAGASRTPSPAANRVLWEVIYPISHEISTLKFNIFEEKKYLQIFFFNIVETNFLFPFCFYTIHFGNTYLENNCDMIIFRMPHSGKMCAVLTFDNRLYLFFQNNNPSL